MPPRSSYSTRTLLSALAVSLALLSNACGVLTPREVYSSRSPNGKAVTAVSEMCGLADCTVSIVIQEGFHSNRIKVARGCVIEFAQAAWSGSRVGVFVDGSLCEVITAAYDTSTHQVIPFESMRPAVEAAIIRDYGVTQDELAQVSGNVLVWAHYPGDGEDHRAKTEFHKRHP